MEGLNGHFCHGFYPQVCPKSHNLPFYNIIATPDASNKFWDDLDADNHGDSGEYNGFYTVEFYMVKKNYDGTPSAVMIEKTKHNTPNY